jgi:pimeloyl-ACP methyl ester carboxylesterase
MPDNVKMRHARTATPPALLHSLLEVRALLEMGALAALTPVLAALPRGDGHPVMLIPGFGAAHGSLLALTVVLRALGYDTETWGQGRNLGIWRQSTEALDRRVRALHHERGRKVSVVGVSLGGAYAFHAAHREPDSVRSVIALGAPMQFSRDGRQAPLLMRAAYRYFAMARDASEHLPASRTSMLRKAPPVPSTCLYSATDGVVHHSHAQLRSRSRTHENVWVPGSHFGLGFNPAVMWLLADRLAQAEGNWKPFKPTGPARFLYNSFAGFAGMQGFVAAPGRRARS